jgi:hypothetical protein
MIGLTSALMIGGLLLLLLLLLAARGISAARGLAVRSDLPLCDDAADFATCPQEFVPRIFSRVDWEFVSQTKSPKLAKLFRRERKAVALLWVRQTSATIQRVMKEHAIAVRGSHDLEFTAEIKLALRYAELMLLCGALFLAIQSAGPLWLSGLALYADSLSRSITEAQQAFAAAATPREIRTLGPF